MQYLRKEKGIVEHKISKLERLTSSEAQKSLRALIKFRALLNKKIELAEEHNYIYSILRKEDNGSLCKMKIELRKLKAQEGH